MALIWEITLFHPIYEEPEAEKTIAGNQNKTEMEKKKCGGLHSCLQLFSNCGQEIFTEKVM